MPRRINGTAINLFVELDELCVVIYAFNVRLLLVTLARLDDENLDFVLQLRAIDVIKFKFQIVNSLIFPVGSADGSYIPVRKQHHNQAGIQVEIDQFS